RLQVLLDIAQSNPALHCSDAPSSIKVVEPALWKELTKQGKLDLISKHTVVIGAAGDPFLGKDSDRIQEYTPPEDHIEQAKEVLKALQIPAHIRRQAYGECHVLTLSATQLHERNQIPLGGPRTR